MTPEPAVCEPDTGVEAPEEPDFLAVEDFFVVDPVGDRTTLETTLDTLSDWLSTEIKTALGFEDSSAAHSPFNMIACGDAGIDTRCAARLPPRKSFNATSLGHGSSATLLSNTGERPCDEGRHEGGFMGEDGNSDRNAGGRVDDDCRLADIVFFFLINYPNTQREIGGEIAAHGYGNRCLSKS